MAGCMHLINVVVSYDGLLLLVCVRGVILVKGIQGKLPPPIYNIITLTNMLQLV